MKYDARTLHEWIDRCMEEHYRPLTNWEENFLESISDDLTRKGWISDRRVEILERIYTEKVE